MFHSILSHSPPLSTTKNCRDQPRVFSLLSPLLTSPSGIVFYQLLLSLKGCAITGGCPSAPNSKASAPARGKGFQKHLIRFARVESLNTWAKNEVRPEIVLLNSHDKSSAYQLHCGLLRMVCLNGMVVADATFQRISIKHVGFSPDSSSRRPLNPRCGS